MEREAHSIRSVLAEQGCPKCDGIGLVRVLQANGGSASRPCECQTEQRTRRKLAQAGIPPRYEHCTLENYEGRYTGADSSLAVAMVYAENFAKNYPLEKTGLLLTGSIGTGKSHLAVGALKRVIAERGAEGLFCDYRVLLREIQNSYNPQVQTTEMEILRPVMTAEVLVLDELGAIRPGEWVWDTVSMVLNERYNQKLTTIITTNYEMASPGSGTPGEETLGDRIGERMRSRLLEMCRIVHLTGQDYRARLQETAIRSGSARGPERVRLRKD